jgi:hypothetical protein
MRDLAVKIGTKTDLAAGSCLIIFEKMTDVAAALIFSKFVILTLFWHSLAY